MLACFLAWSFILVLRWGNASYSLGSASARAAFLNLRQPLALLEVAVEVALAARVLRLRIVVWNGCEALPNRVFDSGKPGADTALHDEPGADPHILQAAPH